MQLMKTFNTTALAVTVLIGSITTSCNSSQSESSDVNAVKLERINRGEKFKQFFWTYAYDSHETYMKVKDNLIPDARDYVFICFYASEKMEIDASESEAALKSYFLSSKPMYDQFIRLGAWEQYIKNSTDSLGHPGRELAPDKFNSNLERGRMVKDYFVEYHDLAVHGYLAVEGVTVGMGSSPYSINATTQQNSPHGWFTPFLNSMPSKDELTRFDDDYLEETRIYSKRELKLEKDCFSPEEVDRIKFNMSIDIK